MLSYLIAILVYLGIILLVFVVMYIAGRCVGAGFSRSIDRRKDQR